LYRWVISAGGLVKVVLYRTRYVSFGLHGSAWISLSHLLEEGKNAVPVPLVLALAELRTGGLGPGIVVEARPAVKEHAVHRTASADHLAG
jgi:hypothetical protein